MRAQRRQQCTGLAMQMGTHQVVVKKPGDTQASPCGQLSIILTDTQIGRNTIVLPTMPITVQEKLDTADALASCARDQVRASLGAPPSAFQADRSSESEKERAKGGRCHLICSAKTTFGCVPQAGSLGSLSVRPQHGTWDDGPNERQDHAHRSCALCAHGTGRGALGRSSVFSFQRQCPQI